MNKITRFGLATIQIQYILVCTNLKANENNCKSNINSFLFNRITKLDGLCNAKLSVLVKYCCESRRFTHIFGAAHGSENIAAKL